MNQRADAFAAAQVQRQAEAQERAAAQAERAREFEQTRLLNVQKIAQDAAQLQQQTAHQTAQEAHQAAQESRLLQQFGLEKEIAGKAGFVEGQSGMYPSHILDAKGNPSFIPQPSVASMPPRERTPVAIKDASGRDIGWDVGGGRILAAPKAVAEGELSDVNKVLVAGIDRQIAQITNAIKTVPIGDSNYTEAAKELAQLQRRRANILSSGTSAPTVLPPATSSVPAVGSTKGATGMIRKLPAAKSDLVVGDLYDVPGHGVGRWNGKQFDSAEVR